MTAVMLTTILPMQVIAQQIHSWTAETVTAFSEEDILAALPEMEDEAVAYPILGEVEEKRDAYTKHFITSEHTFIAASYPYAVHYEENGAWQEIDNTLQLKADSEQGNYYENTASNTHVRFAQTSDQEQLVTIQTEDDVIAWGLSTEESISDQEDVSASAEENIALQMNPDTEDTASGLESNTAVVVPANQVESQQPISTFVVENPQPKIATFAADPSLPEEQEEIEAYNLEKMTAPTIAAKGTYENILPNVNLEYIVISNVIKENITLLNSSAADTRLSFTISHPGLEIRLDDSGEVILYRAELPDEIVYQFSAPYMYDAQGTISKDVAYVLETNSETQTSILTINPNREWLKAEDRAYPVVIDPNVETSRENRNIDDTFVREKQPNSSDVAYNGSFEVGNSYVYGKSRSLVKFQNLPALNNGDIIYYGQLVLWQRGFSAVGEQKFNITAHRVTGSWQHNTATWNNQPAFDSTVLDYMTVEPVLSGTTVNVTPRSVNITKLVRDWYNTGVNNGVLLKAADESRMAAAIFFSSEYPQDELPQISSAQFPGGYFYYKNANGVEDYWNYLNQSVGRAGTGYTNLYTGNQVFIHQDAGTTGERLPISISHVYNLSESQTSSRFGNGWRLNVMQQLVATGDANYPYKYTDSDGTAHYFYKDQNDGNKLKDEDGLGLEITDTTPTNRTITTKDGYKLVFDSDSYLRKEIDPNGNTITYQYGPNANGNYIGYATDPTGARIYFHYTEDKSRLTSITDGAGRTITYTYTNDGNLQQISYPDGTSTSFTYNGKKLQSVHYSDGYTVEYSYVTDMSVPRVSSIRETSGNISGQQINLSYRNGNTTVVEDCGLDGNIGAKSDNNIITYNFDNMGRVTDVYDANGNANSYAYYSEGLTNNKLSQSGNTQRTVYNYLTNPNLSGYSGFVDTWSNQVEGPNGGVTRVSDVGYIDNRSVRVTSSHLETKVGLVQNVTLPAGEYTFSAYIKSASVTVSGEDTGAVLQVKTTSSGNFFSERFVTGPTDENVDNGWERLSVTFTLPSAQTVTVWAGLYLATGTVWFDCLQLEQGNVANKVNILCNSGFEQVSSNKPSSWNLGSTATASSTQAKFGSRSAVMTGQIGVNQHFLQGIYVSGQEGDVFSLSGWVKADALPGRQARIAAAVLYNTGSAKWVTLDINPYVSDWQYLHGIVSTDDQDSSTNRTYREIHLYIMYYDQANPLYIDGLQFTKDNGQSYVYDSEGNLTSSITAAESSSFTVDNENNLTKLLNPDGTTFDYAYDANNNLEAARNLQGVQYNYTYDSNGNASTVKAQGGDQYGSLLSGRRYYLRNKSTGQYMDVSRNLNENGRNVQTYTFHGGENQQWGVHSTGDGYYQLITCMPNSGRALGVDGGKNERKANVAIYDNHQTDATKFKIKAMPGGGYQIIPKCTNDTKAVDFEGNNVQLWDANENDNQIWYFEPVRDSVSDEPEGDTIFKVRSRHSGKYLDVSQGTVNQYLYQYFHHNGFEQQFYFKDLENGYYQIIPMMKTAHALSAPNGAIVTVQQADENDTNQHFKLVSVGDGTYRIVPRSNESNALAISDGSVNKGAKIQSMAYTGAVSQKWILEAVSDAVTSSATYTSDGRNLASTTDARGNTTTNTYDSRNRLLTSTTDPAGNTTTYTYNSSNDLLTGVSATVGDQTVTNSYSYTNRRLTGISHNGFNYSFAYDGFGNVTSTSVGSQVLSSNTYLPGNGPLSSSTYGNGDSVGYTYDNLYRTTGKSYDGQTAFTYVYDAYGNLARTTDLVNNVTYTYQYDMVGRVIGMDSTQNQTIRVAYDDKNRTDYVINRVNGTGTKTQYVYGSGQNSGLIQGVRIDDQDVLSYTYDEMGRTASRMLELEGGNKLTATYEYLDGNGIGTTTPLVSRMTLGMIAWDYTYDSRGNIETIDWGLSISPEPFWHWKYYYDELNQLIREDDQRQGKTITYSYDAGGNITSRKEYPYTTGELGEPIVTITYSYGDSNWKDKLTSYNGSAITYDEIGNPLIYHDGKQFTWQHGRQLASLSDNGLSVSYTYDDSGIRTSKTVNGTETQYYLNGSTILTQITGDDRLDFFYDESGLLIGFFYNGTKYYYQRNFQGDITGIQDGNGVLAASYTYDSWGKLISIEGTEKDTIGVLNPFRYRGYYYDTESGFYYLNSRYYDPVVGRFLNADAIACVIGATNYHNVFTYCENNPINLSDPTGRIAGIDDATVLLGLAVALLATGIYTTFTNPDVQRGFNEIARSIQDIIDNINSDINTQDQSVYVLRDTKNQVRYVGRTNNTSRRDYQHKNDPNHPERSSYHMDVVFTGLTKPQAIAVEQFLISTYTLQYLDNMRREIAVGNLSKYAENAGMIAELFQCIPENMVLNYMER